MTITVCRGPRAGAMAAEEDADVGPVQAGRRLVEDVERVAAARAGSTRPPASRAAPRRPTASSRAGRAAGSRGRVRRARPRMRAARGWSASSDAASSSVVSSRSWMDRPRYADLQRLVVEAPAAARVADDVHLAEEVHPDLLHARALAGLAPPAGDVEREPALAEPARDRLGQRGEQVADDVGQPGVGGRVRPRRPADRRLVDRR